MIEGLRKNGADVVECHETLWINVDDRIKIAKGGWFSIKFLFRVIKVYSRLIKEFFCISDYDVMVIGYPGQLDIFLAWILNKFKRRPLVWDVLMSINLIIEERNLNKNCKFTSRLVRLVEKIGFRLPDLLVIEGEEYAKWLCEEYGLNIKKFLLIPLGTSETKFPLLPEKLRIPSTNFQVVYYGSFLRNHGIEKMLHAAASLCNENLIKFTFIGDGPEYASAVKLSEENQLSNVKFTGYLPEELLIEHLMDADLCLGTFGTTVHSMISIQNKIYEIMVMGKPLLTGESPAISRQFISGHHLITVPRNSHDIAKKIVYLRDNPDLLLSIAKQGRNLIVGNYCPLPIGAMFIEHLKSLVYWRSTL